MRRLFILAVAFLTLASPAMAGRSGYSYTDTQAGVRQAELSINTYTLSQTASHVAVYIDVDANTDELGYYVPTRWLQLGVIAWNGEAMEGGPSSGLCAYLEVMANGIDDVRCLAPVTLGEKVAVKMTYSKRFGWVAWLNGQPVGSLTMRGGATFVAAERYGQATLQYSLRTAVP